MAAQQRRRANLDFGVVCQIDDGVMLENDLLFIAVNKVILLNDFKLNLIHKNHKHTVIPNFKVFRHQHKLFLLTLF